MLATDIFLNKFVVIVCVDIFLFSLILSMVLRSLMLGLIVLTIIGLGTLANAQIMPEDQTSTG